MWGYRGFMKHFRSIRSFYKERRDVIVKLAEKHLQGKSPTDWLITSRRRFTKNHFQKISIITQFLGLVDIKIPSAGFFLWIKVRGINDTWKMVMQRGVTNGILVAPGAAFMADPSAPCNAIRASFAKATYAEMDLVSKNPGSKHIFEIIQNLRRDTFFNKIKIQFLRKHRVQIKNRRQLIFSKSTRLSI